MTASTARPAAVHAIRDGEFVCLGSPDCECRWYPDCDCEGWPCGHDAVQQTRCWVPDWINADHLGNTHDSIDWSPEWPDGEAEYEWQIGGGVTWHYVDAELTPKVDDDDEDEAPLSIATKAGLTVFAICCVAVMFHQELSGWWS